MGISILEKNLSSLWHYLFDWASLDIRYQDLVLEIGSGQRPMIRSDVLCDKYLSDDTERTGSILIDRPFVVADAEALPFADKSFDYIYASHVIEHIRNPALFATELMRVGKKGCIRCPSRLAEKFIGWSLHRWFVSVENNRLILEEKTRPIFDDDLSSFSHMATRFNDGGAFAGFIYTYRDYFFVNFEWRDRIDFEVKKGEAAGVDRMFLHAEVSGCGQEIRDSRMERRKKQVAKFLSNLIRILHSRVKPFSIFEILTCPTCKTHVLPREISSSELSCPSCLRRYPVVGGIPIMLLGDQNCLGERPAFPLGGGI